MNELAITILKIYLDRTSLSLSQLSAIMNKDVYSLSEPISYLRKNNYLRIESNHATLKKLTSNSVIDSKTPLQITFEGKIVLESEAKISKAKRNEWIRYTITTAIAVAAFIKSFFF